MWSNKHFLSLKFNNYVKYCVLLFCFSIWTDFCIPKNKYKFFFHFLGINGIFKLFQQFSSIFNNLSTIFLCRCLFREVSVLFLLFENYESSFVTDMFVNYTRIIETKTIENRGKFKTLLYKRYSLKEEYLENFACSIK